MRNRIFDFLSQNRSADRGANEGGVGGVTPPNNFTIRSQSLFCGVKVGPDPALNLNCLLFVNGSEQSCTTKLCYSRIRSRFCSIPRCIEVSHSDLVSFSRTS